MRDTTVLLVISLTVLGAITWQYRERKQNVCVTIVYTSETVKGKFATPEEAIAFITRPRIDEIKSIAMNPCYP